MLRLVAEVGKTNNSFWQEETAVCRMTSASHVMRYALLNA